MTMEGIKRNGTGGDLSTFGILSQDLHVLLCFLCFVFLFHVVNRSPYVAYTYSPYSHDVLGIFWAGEMRFDILNISRPC